jgi:hypothetical protein
MISIAATPKKREWTTTDDGTVVCFSSETYDCVVVDSAGLGGRDPFLAVTALSDSHDAVLQRSTAEINRVLREAAGSRKDPRRELSILLTEDGPILAWVAITVDKSDRDAVAKALRIDSTHG